MQSAQSSTSILPKNIIILNLLLKSGNQDLTFCDINVKIMKKQLFRGSFAAIVNSM